MKSVNAGGCGSLGPPADARDHTTYNLFYAQQQERPC